MRLRPDFRAAVSLTNRLHRESGEEFTFAHASVINLALLPEQHSPQRTIGRVERHGGIMKIMMKAATRIIT